MPRSPQEVFQHHAEALGAGDLDAIVDDYSDDAVFITPDGIMRGKDGIDTFILRDGQIRLQTVRYTLQHTLRPGG
jgi:ketosteroid isomerase-like protein